MLVPDPRRKKSLSPLNMVLVVGFLPNAITFFFFWTCPRHAEVSRSRIKIRTAAVTMPDPEPDMPPKNSSIAFN